MRPDRVIVIGLLVGAVLPATAAAKAVKSVGYPFGPVWSAAVRMIRVDRRYPITDKDRKNGYILFTHPGNGARKTCPASLELFEKKDSNGRLWIHVQLSIVDQPSYVEAHFLDKLQDKLYRELGPEPERHPRKQKKPEEGKKPDGDEKKPQGDEKKKDATGDKQ